MPTASGTITYSIDKSVRPLHEDRVSGWWQEHGIGRCRSSRDGRSINIRPRNAQRFKIKLMSVQILTANDEDTTTVDGNKRRKRIMIASRVSVLEKSGVADAARRAKCLADRYLCCDRLSADNLVREMSLPDAFWDVCVSRF